MDRCPFLALIQKPHVCIQGNTHNIHIQAALPDCSALAGDPQREPPARAWRASGSTRSILPKPALCSSGFTLGDPKALVYGFS